MAVIFWTMAGLLFAGTLPYWLPSAVLALRMRIFAGINGDEGIAIPGAQVSVSRFKQVYSHPAANGRSRGAALSDLFWYWLSPGPEMHQEHLEAGERYEEVARATRRILALPRPRAEALMRECVARVLIDPNLPAVMLVRLRDLMMPIWADFYYEVVFGEPCPRVARQLIVRNASDVVTALKCCSLRHMDRRHRLTAFLVDKLQQGRIPHSLPDALSLEQRALYLQGVFFNTAIVQMSEAMAHLLMVLAGHREIQERLARNPQDEQFLDHVMAETLRLYPLFGISHRITSADIAVGPRQAIPKGSVLCFNYPEYHRAGFEDAARFDPDRWKDVSLRDANYIPFGVTGNRPCPAQNLALITMRAATRQLLQHFTFLSSASHTRALPSRGPCLLVRTGHRLDGRRRDALLLFIRGRDRAEDVWRSMVQLVLGTYMVWDARRLRLCERHFGTEGSGGGRPASGPHAGICPIR
jgi:hypothetical protein